MSKYIYCCLYSTVPLKFYEGVELLLFGGGWVIVKTTYRKRKVSSDIGLGALCAGERTQHSFRFGLGRLQMVGNIAVPSGGLQPRKERTSGRLTARV